MSLLCLRRSTPPTKDRTNAVIMYRCTMCTNITVSHRRTAPALSSCAGSSLPAAVSSGLASRLPSRRWVLVSVDLVVHHWANLRNSDTIHLRANRASCQPHLLGYTLGNPENLPLATSSPRSRPGPSEYIHFHQTTTPRNPHTPSESSPNWPYMPPSAHPTPHPPPPLASQSSDTRTAKPRPNGSRAMRLPLPAYAARLAARTTSCQTPLA